MLVDLGGPWRNWRMAWNHSNGPSIRTRELGSESSFIIKATVEAAVRLVSVYSTIQLDLDRHKDESLRR